MHMRWERNENYEDNEDNIKVTKDASMYGFEISRAVNRAAPYLDVDAKEGGQTALFNVFLPCAPI